MRRSTARRRNGFSLQLLPHFARPVIAMIFLPDPLDLGNELFVTPGSLTALLRLVFQHYQSQSYQSSY